MFIFHRLFEFGSRLSRSCAISHASLVPRRNFVIESGHYLTSQIKLQLRRSLENHNMASLKKPHNQSFVEAVTDQQSSSSDLVREFVAPINEAIDVSEKAIEDSIWNAWQDVTSLARQIPHEKHEKLVGFVNELMEQPVAVTGQELLKQKGGWKALPGLGMEMRECWNSCKLTTANLDLFHRKLTRLSTTWQRGIRRRLGQSQCICSSTHILCFNRRRKS